MNRFQLLKGTPGPRRKSLRVRNRRGTTVVELLVAAGLLVTVAGLVATCAVGAKRLTVDSRQRSLANNELCNQIETLKHSLAESSSSEIEDVLADVQPSDELLARLPNAELGGQLVDDEHGLRIRLQMQWERRGNPPPLVAVAWLPQKLGADEVANEESETSDEL